MKIGKLVSNAFNLNMLKLQNFPSWLVIVIILALNIAIYVFGQRNRAVSLLESEKGVMRPASLLPYDYQINELPKDILNNIDPNWKLILLTAIDPETPSDKLYYLDILSRKYKDRGLEVVIIHNRKSQQDSDIKNRFRLSFPVISDDSSNLKNFFHIGIGSSKEGVIIISSDKDKRVKFSDFRVPKEDETRILVEKYLNDGRIDYSYYTPKPLEFFRRGQSIPPIKLKALDNSEEQVFESGDFRGKTLILFLADCSSCKLPGYVKRLAELEKDKALTNDSLIAIFPSSVPIEKLKAQVSGETVSSKIYILRGDVQNLQDEAATRSQTSGTEPLLIQFDKRGIVSLVSKLNQ